MKTLSERALELAGGDPAQALRIVTALCEVSNEAYNRGLEDSKAMYEKYIFRPIPFWEWLWR